jgi:hypothetical protein
MEHGEKPFSSKNKSINHLTYIIKQIDAAENHLATETKYMDRHSQKTPREYKHAKLQIMAKC